MLDYDVKRDIERLLINLKQHSPTYWLTKELDTFMQAQNGADCIDKKAFDQWILNLKIMYMMTKELKTDQVTLPPTTSQLGAFVQQCIAILPRQYPLKTGLQQNLFNKNLKKEVNHMIEDKPTDDTNLRIGDIRDWRTT